MHNSCLDALRGRSGVPPKVVVGGVIPEEDYTALYNAGVVAIFGM
jgi:methylmalonyl-CoA mutase cobalamin-binding domain/chain